MMRLILALFAICIYSVPALAYPQPSIEAYGEAPEVQHAALSDWSAPRKVVHYLS